MLSRYLSVMFCCLHFFCLQFTHHKFFIFIILTRNFASISVQTDLKKLLRNPPLVKIPKISDLLSFHPLFGAIPHSICAPLEGSTKETMKLRGVTLYKEGSKPNGIWLISNGVVKVSKKLPSDYESKIYYFFFFFRVENDTNEKCYLAVDE